MKRTLLIVSLALSVLWKLPVLAQKVTISPTPQKIVWGEKAFDNSMSYVLQADDADVDAVDLLKSKLKIGSGVSLIVGESGDKAVAAYESLIPQQAEGYYLKVSSDKVVIAGRDASGTYYGVQSFLQVVSQPKVMQVEITDYPDTPLRGTIEGFYGNPWSHADRKSQFDFYGKNKMNIYVYGPKDDLYHRDRWRENYPEAEAKKLAELAKYAAKNKVQFVWAIHPGGSIKWNKTDSLNIIKKLETVYKLGVRTFSVFFDDINGEGTKADKQAALLNYIWDEFVKKHDDIKGLSMCPTQYCRAYMNGEDYLLTLGNKMYKQISVMWTGNGVVDMINEGDVSFVERLIKRKPFIWLNYPVNDYCNPHILMGKTDGNDLTLAGRLDAFCSNPMEMAEASKVSLYSIADYSWNMSDYNAQQSWERAMTYLMPSCPDAFMVFCENNVDLGPTWHGLRIKGESPRFRTAMQIFEKAIEKGYDAKAVAKMRLQMDTLVWAADRMSQDSLQNALMMNELSVWVQKMRFMGMRGQLLMDMYADVENNAPEAFLEKFKKIKKLMESESKLIFRNFEGSIKHPTPVVGTDILDPWLKEQMLRLQSAYKAKYSEGWENFTPVLLENGDYYIKYKGKYLTNSVSSTYPTFISKIDESNPQRSLWTITLDAKTERYKIVNAYDGRYINENGQFTANASTNPYEAEWHTYTLRMINGNYAICTAGSAGQHWWSSDGTRINRDPNKAGAPALKDFAFQIVPVNGEKLSYTTLSPDATYYIKAGENLYLTDVNRNGTGQPVFQNKAETKFLLNYQKWRITPDAGTGRWKISSSVADTRYLNELGAFGRNAYTASWNTYAFSEMNGRFSIQNAENAGTNFWGVDNAGQIFRSDLSLDKSYIFSLVNTANTTNGIEAPSDSPQEQVIYNLQGIKCTQKTDSLQPGVYLINKKKVSVR